ncbi:MAG: gliding motility-associated C-terminal domain-containing protein [Bacteroidota bacterium]|nr:gliding motility-associated C-terminal domain-containing protein [Bacteroidota bacterium]
MLTELPFVNATGPKNTDIGLVHTSLLVKPPCDLLEPTIIDSVSVNPTTGVISISWLQNPSPDVDYYVVYVYNPLTSPPWDAIDTVFGAANLSSFINSYNSSTGSYTFSVSAHDNCGNSSFFSLETAHNTIFLEAEYNACELEMNLKWNKYNNWQNGVINYKIWASVNAAQYQLVGVTANTDTTFKHSGVSSQANICYYIQAIASGSSKTSGSNRVCVFTDFPDAPAYSYIRYASVTGSTSIKVLGLVDASVAVLNYVIERRTLGTFNEIAQILPTELNGDTLEFIDNDVKTNENSYAYRFKSINSCNKESAISNEAKTILLDIKNSNNEMVNTLNWSDYQYFDAGVQAYNIYRSIDGVYSEIATLPVGTNFYEDHVADYYYSNGEFCYFIQAVEEQGNVHFFKEKSNSNQKCIEQAPFMYVPNAFTPQGNNPIFKPVFSFVEPTTYNFSIYNRWGEKFFETTSPQEGWDGFTNSGMAPTGAYIYKISYGSAFGEPFLKTGTVTLIH